MSWIKDVVAPKIKAFMGGRSSSIKEDLWVKCPECEKVVYSADLKDQLLVCSACGYHFRMLPSERLKILFDNAEYQEIQLVEVLEDPLKFKDIKKYTDRLKEARDKTGLYDAARIAYGEIYSYPAVVFIMDFTFMGGSMGRCIGQSFAKAIDTAIEKRVPFISFTASGGARMQEGMLSLYQMASTTASICKLKEAGLAYINVFTHPTTGGVLASFATLGDIHIAEPGALIGFAGARVIEKTIKKTLPEGFQRASFLLEHGLIDMIVPRKELKHKLKLLLSYMS